MRYEFTVGRSCRVKTFLKEHDISKGLLAKIKFEGGHIWVNGEDIDGDNIPGASAITNWSNATNAPENPKLNDVIYLTAACAAITGSKTGEIYQYNGTTWEKYTGVIYAQN